MKRHPVDSVALVFALLFSAALVWWAVATITNDPLHVPTAWLGAGILLVVGLVGLISALRPQPRAEAPLTVAPEPQPALQVVSDPYADLYADPYFHASTLNVGEGVLDPETVAAAYREAGFSDTDHLLSPVTKVDDGPTAEVRPDETEAPPQSAEQPAEEEDPPTLVDPLRPTDRDGGPAS